MDTREVIAQVHEEAQACLREAQIWKAIGDEGKTLFYCDQAFRLGRIVLDALLEELDEVTSSKLHLNLSSIALTTGRNEDAIFLAERGLEQVTDGMIRSQLEGVIYHAKLNIESHFVY